MEVDGERMPDGLRGEAPGRAAERRDWSWTCDPTETGPTVSDNGPRPWHSRATGYATVIAWANLLGR